MSFVIAPFAAMPSPLMPLGALLVVAGVALITYGIRVSHEAVARRVDLVRPRATAEMTSKKQTQALEKRFLRLPRGRPEREQREIIRRLSKLGIPARYAPSFFTASKVLAAAGLSLFMLMVLPHVPAFANLRFAMPLALTAGAIMGWLLPSIFIRVSARQRATAVAAAMPEALDLLVVCVDAGLSLEDSLARVVSELRQSRPALTDELALTSADLQILPSRDEAFARMADRVDLPSVRSVVATLAQTLRYGTPLAQGLRVIAAEMRNDALVQLEERANRLPALMTVPMMAFIMPTILLIIGGPAALRLLDVLGR